MKRLSRLPATGKRKPVGGTHRPWLDELIADLIRERAQVKDDMNTLGSRLYGDRWPEVLEHNLNRMTRGERRADNEDYQKLLNGLNALASDRSVVQK
jgi:hypothetical protein